MNINHKFREFIIYGVAFTSQSSLEELKASLSVLGTLVHRVDNKPWATFSFVPSSAQPDSGLSCNLTFQSGKLRMMALCPDPAGREETVADATQLLRTFAEQQNKVDWAEIRYFKDSKAAFDYLSVNFTE